MGAANRADAPINAKRPLMGRPLGVGRPAGALLRVRLLLGGIPGGGEGLTAKSGEASDELRVGHDADTVEDAITDISLSYPEFVC